MTLSLPLVQSRQLTNLKLPSYMQKKRRNRYGIQAGAVAIFGFRFRVRVRVRVRVKVRASG